MFVPRDFRVLRRRPTERKRVSLKTADLEITRGRRDGIIADLQDKAYVFGR